MSCLIRKTPVVLTPEEIVRQALLHLMTHSLGYPAGLISVEVSLDNLPGLSEVKKPNRRADIIVFSQEIKPLLLIECKAIALSQSAIQQVIGYNHFVKAPYIALANPKEIKTGMMQDSEWSFTAGLPRFKQIIER